MAPTKVFFLNKNSYFLQLKQFQLKTKTDIPSQNVLPTQDTNIMSQSADSNSVNAIPMIEMDLQPNHLQQCNTVESSQLGNFFAAKDVNMCADNNVNITKPIQSASYESTEVIQQMPQFNYHTPVSHENQSIVSMQYGNVDAIEMIPELNSQSSLELIHLKQQNLEISQALHSTHVENQQLKLTTAKQFSEVNQLKAALQQLNEQNNNNQKLQHELDSHVKTVNILVGEKAELVGKLQAKEQWIKETDSQIMELQGRLKASRFRVAELEKDITTKSQLNQSKANGPERALGAQIEQLTEENKRLQKLNQELNDDNTENHHQLVVKTKEIDSMKNVLNAKQNELEMLRIRLQQLNDTNVDNVNVSDQLHSREQRESESERQVIELQNMISDITNDRDRIEQQYKTYVKHLTTESTSMTQRIDELTKHNDKLSKREESLVHHVRDLEKQIQKQISTQQRLAALKVDNVQPPTNASPEQSTNHDETLRAIQTKLDECEKERANLQVSRFFKPNI